MKNLAKSLLLFAISTAITLLTVFIPNLYSRTMSRIYLIKTKGDDYA